MDQVKKLMAGLYKYGFWISCGLIAIGSVAIGVMATMAVQEQAKAQVTRIKSSISSIQPVSAVKDHPNDKTAAARDKVNLDLERDVFELWQKNFKKQRVILTWPDEVGSLFLTEIQDPKYLQPELIPFPEPTTGLLSRTARDNYRNYIVAELPKLAPLIKAKWHLDLTTAPTGGIGGPGGMMGPGAGGKTGGPPGGIGGVGGPPGGIGGIGGPPGGIGGMGGAGGEGGGPGGGIGGMGTSQVYDPSEVVAWDASSQQLLASKVLRGMERANTPSTLDILYAQEDLWIVKALLNVIAKTNGDALERHRAPIKEIKTLSTGQDAGVKVGGIKMLHTAGSATGSAAPGAPGTGTGGPTAPGTGAGGPVAGKGPAAPGGGDPYGGGAANAVASHPAEMRYVDKKFTYRAHKDIQAAIDSEAFADVDLALAKRIPFRMTLVMDQRELNKLLVNCGNNELMVEVAQVRYNPQAVSTGSSMGGMGGMPGVGGPGAPGAGGMPGAPGAGGMGKGGPGAGSGGAGIGGEEGGGMGGGGGNSGSSVQIAGPVGLSPYDILVDIYGYVQLYNVPATKKFKLLEKANAEAGATPGANAAPAPGVNPTPVNPAVNPVTPPAEAAAAPAAPAEAGGATQGDPATPASGAPATPGETPPATQGGTPPANASPPPGATPPAGQTPPAGTEPSGTPPAGTTPGASP